MKELDERSLSNLKGVHPLLVKLLQESAKEADFIVICGVRTESQQKALYAQGRTKPGLKVSNCDGIKSKSNHQMKDDGFGHAVDLYSDSNSNGKLDSFELNDVESLKKVAEIIKKVSLKLGIAIVWGGDWKMKDYPHFELK